MAAERIIGVDFGTSTSVMRVKRYLNGKPVEDRLSTKAVTFNMGSTMLPTLIRKVEGGTYYGYDAQTPKKKSVLHQNFKVDLESTDPQKKAQARELTREFFGYMAQVYQEQSAGGHLGEVNDTEKTLISYPVKWSEETKAFMLEAARKAGFPNVEGMDEAQAAIHAAVIQNEDHLSKKGYLVDGQSVNIMLIDMGAGTTDIVICRYTPGQNPKTEVLCTWPTEGKILFGGREVDELLMEYMKGLLPEDEAEIVMKRCGMEKFKVWKDNVLSPALAKGEAVTEFYDFDEKAEAFCEEAPEYNINSEEFERHMSAYLRKFPVLVRGSIAEAELRGSNIDLVILAGGHSQWYFVKDILTEKLSTFGSCGLDRIKEDTNRVIGISLPQETVALGLVYQQITVQKGGLKHIPPVAATCEEAGVYGHWKDVQTGMLYWDEQGERETNPEKVHLPPMGHEFIWRTEDGRRFQYCTRCGETRNVSIAEEQPEPNYQHERTQHIQQGKKVPRCYGDLVNEFIDTIQAPPGENCSKKMTIGFFRKIRDYYSLEDNERILYSNSELLQGTFSAGSFYMTSFHLITPKFYKHFFVKGYKKTRWEDFINAKIENDPVYGSLLINRESVMATDGISFGTKKQDRWRLFYLDLQKYLRDNACRIQE